MLEKCHIVSNEVKSKPTQEGSSPSTTLLRLTKEESKDAMNKAYKFRLYPNKEQEKVFNETLETCRRLYNHFLWERKTTYEEEKAENLSKEERTKFNKYTQQYKLPEMKKENHYLKKAPAIVLQDVSHRVHTSFQNFFRRVKNGDEKPGYPKFKKYHEYNSFTYNGAQTFSFREGKLYLTKFGLVKIKIHRIIPENAELKICAIIREIDKWYASIIIEYENKLGKPELDSNKAVGIDLGINYLAVLSNGEFFENPKWLKQYEKRLAQLHRNHSRKKKGSENKRKSAKEIARLHKKISNKKKDHYHKVTADIVDRFDYIVFEDLKIKNMVKNKHLAKSISDVSWYMFRLMIENKAKEKGKIVVLIDPKYTSQNCSNCGVKVEKSLAVRTHKCPECGLVIDRDLNAAINILNKGLEKLRSSIDNTVGSTGSASGEVSEETLGKRNDTKRTGSPTTIVTRPLTYENDGTKSTKRSPTTKVSRPRSLVQEQNDSGSTPRALAITNYYDTNKREKTSFWMSFKDIMLQIVHHSLVFIRGRSWSKNFFHKFNNSLPIYFLFLLPRLFIFFPMHQGSQQGRVGMRILLETPPVNPSPSDYPPYYYRRNICE
ncbi:MAG: IS200/IS605 family element transposase accessory protein TnpB [Candidatus Heimdallarchaeota archaeon]|nr:IS200/IS605 family element transposase accessory protein TnpB [Candidatus Heimdallarchaeota archaeon]